MDEIVGVSEIAKMAGVSRNLIATWVHRDKVPMPDFYINDGATKVWKRETIENWLGEDRLVLKGGEIYE